MQLNFWFLQERMLLKKIKEHVLDSYLGHLMCQCPMLEALTCIIYVH